MFGRQFRPSPLWLRSTETTSAWVPRALMPLTISEPGNSDATADTSYTAIFNSSPAYTSKITSVLSVSISDTPFDRETRMVSTPSSIALWLIFRK